MWTLVAAVADAQWVVDGVLDAVVDESDPEEILRSIAGAGIVAQERNIAAGCGNVSVYAVFELFNNTDDRGVLRGRRFQEGIGLGNQATLLDEDLFGTTISFGQTLAMDPSCFSDVLHVSARSSAASLCTSPAAEVLRRQEHRLSKTSWLPILSTAALEGSTDPALPYDACAWTAAALSTMARDEAHDRLYAAWGLQEYTGGETPPEAPDDLWWSHRPVPGTTPWAWPLSNGAYLADADAPPAGDAAEHHVSLAVHASGDLYATWDDWHLSPHGTRLASFRWDVGVGGLVAEGDLDISVRTADFETTHPSLWSDGTRVTAVWRESQSGNHDTLWMRTCADTAANCADVPSAWDPDADALTDPELVLSLDGTTEWLTSPGQVIVVPTVDGVTGNPEPSAYVAYVHRDVDAGGRAYREVRVRAKECGGTSWAEQIPESVLDAFGSSRLLDQDLGKGHKNAMAFAFDTDSPRLYLVLVGDNAATGRSEIHLVSRPWPSC